MVVPAEYLATAAALLREALAALAQGNPGGAVWRAVDAAAILAAELPADVIGGFTEPTGRGYRLAVLEE